MYALILNSVLLCTSIIIAIEDIISSPTNMTVCRAQSTIVEFGCIVLRNGVSITAADWQILVEGEFQSVQGMPRHVTDSSITGDVIFGILRVTDVVRDDNGNQYRCSPTNATVSDIATLTVLGKSIVYTYCIIKIEENVLLQYGMAELNM